MLHIHAVVNDTLLNAQLESVVFLKVSHSFPLPCGDKSHMCEESGLYCNISCLYARWCRQNNSGKYVFTIFIFYSMHMLYFLLFVCLFLSFFLSAHFTFLGLCVWITLACFMGTLNRHSGFDTVTKCIFYFLSLPKLNPLTYLSCKTLCHFFRFSTHTHTHTQT